MEENDSVVPSDKIESINMGRRFFSEDDDDYPVNRDEFEEFEGDSPEELIEKGFVDLTDFHLIENENKHKLLKHAISIAKKDIFWYFRHPAVKIDIINTIFSKLEKMIES